MKTTTSGAAAAIRFQAIRTEGVPGYQRPKRPNPQLVPFEGRLQELYFREHLIGSRILRELRNDPPLLSGEAGDVQRNRAVEQACAAANHRAAVP